MSLFFWFGNGKSTERETEEKRDQGPRGASAIFCITTKKRGLEVQQGKKPFLNWWPT